MQYNRGGKSLKVGDIGRLQCLRQNILMPGETMKTSIRGNVRLAGLVQQTSVYLHAQIEAFAAPLRWYWSDFTEYLKEGQATSKNIPILNGTDWLQNREATCNLGIGSLQYDWCKWFAQHPINIFNEWYRWPEDAKTSVDTPPITHFENQGPKCVNLPSAASRLHDAPSFSASEYQVPSATILDVKALELYQARFAQAAKIDWTSQDRYNVFMGDIFGTKGSNEVDKVPIRLRKGAELTVLPKDMYASDGPSLGTLMSINNFQVSHAWDPFVAQEHMVVAYMMVLRFAPIMEDSVMPGVQPSNTIYPVYQGDPNILAALEPVPVLARELDGNGGAGVVGYLPAGWQLREGYNHIDHIVADLNTFPLMDNQPLTAAGYRDASLVNGGVFRSTALRDWFADLDFTVSITGRTPKAGTSIMAGADGSGTNPKGNHPTGGNVI